MDGVQRQFRLGYRPELDAFRGVAVLMVMVGHIGISFLHRAGTIGVTLFFVLSGFLITRLLIEEWETRGHIDLKRFYVRRALRLFPAMVAFLAVMSFVSIQTGASLRPVVYTLLYVANVAAAAGRDLGVLGHAWSLSAEEQFYAVWPLVLVAVLSLRPQWRRGPVILAAAGISVVTLVRGVLIVTQSGGASWSRVNFGPDTRADALLIGCMLGLLVTAAVRWRFTRTAATAGVAVVAVASLMPRSIAFYMAWLPLASVAGAAIILAIVAHPHLRVVLAGARLRPLVWTGKISYGLYLWHFPIYQLGKPLIQPLPAPIKAVVLVAASFAAAAISYYVIEAPFLRMKRRFANANANVNAVARPGIASTSAPPLAGYQPASPPIRIGGS